MILTEMMQGPTHDCVGNLVQKKRELFKKQLDMLQLQFILAKSQQGECNSDSVLKQSDNNNIFKCLFGEGGRLLFTIFFFNCRSKKIIRRSRGDID